MTLFPQSKSCFKFPFNNLIMHLTHIYTSYVPVPSANLLTSGTRGIRDPSLSADILEPVGKFSVVPQHMQNGSLDETAHPFVQQMFIEHLFAQHCTWSGGWQNEGELPCLQGACVQRRRQMQKTILGKLSSVTPWGTCRKEGRECILRKSGEASWKRWSSHHWALLQLSLHVSGGPSLHVSSGRTGSRLVGFCLVFPTLHTDSLPRFGEKRG